MLNSMSETPPLYVTCQTLIKSVINAKSPYNGWSLLIMEPYSPQVKHRCFFLLHAKVIQILQ